jgi:signal transduction histidine kinase
MNEHRLRRTNLDLEHQVSSKHLELSDKGEKLRGIISQLANTEERERRQLATELHDYLAQLLTLARMKINQADQHAYRSAGDSHRYMRETDDLLRRSIEYVRTLMMAELHPTQLYQSGLPAALRWLVEQMPRHGLTVELSISSESLPLTSDHALLLYLSVRELLMNIVKHAAVNRALVTVDAESKCVLITVQDSGQGFDPSALPPTASGHHLGLQSVHERITAIGGTVEIQSSVGKGATIRLTVPTHPLSASEEVRAASLLRRIASEQSLLPPTVSRRFLFRSTLDRHTVPRRFPSSIFSCSSSHDS